MDRILLVLFVFRFKDRILPQYLIAFAIGTWKLSLWLVHFYFQCLCSDYLVHLLRRWFYPECAGYLWSIISEPGKAPFLCLNWFSLGNSWCYRISSAFFPGMVVHSASCALSSPSSLFTDFWFYILMGWCPICVSSFPKIVALGRLGFVLSVFLFLLRGVIISDLFACGVGPIIFNSNIAFIWFWLPPFPLFWMFRRFLKA